MSDQTLFNEQTTTTPASTQPDTTAVETPTDPYNTLLQGIKTDDGRQKYATVSDALTSIPDKETFIETLKSENAVFREEMEKMKARLDAAEALQSQPNTDTGQPQTEQPNTAIDVDTLTQSVMQKLSAQEQEKVATQRIDQFKAKLVETYGEKAAEVYKGKVAESGLSEQVIIQAAAQNPDSAFKFLGLDINTTVETNSVPTSTRNSTSTETTRTDDAPRFRPGNQPRPGSKFAAQKEETVKRLKEQGLI